MPDPNTIAYGYAYIDDDKTLIAFVAHMALERTWFDVRVPRDHRWQVCFNPAIRLPTKLAKALIPHEAPEHPADLAFNKAKYKANRDRADKGGRKR